MPASFLASLAEQTEGLRAQGLFKAERLIAGPQQADIDVRMNGSTQHVLNLCANNYLGLANHPEVISAAHKALDDFGYGMASVRFICGTQTIHKDLEHRISDFLGTEDTILYPSCFDANGGLFETLLGPEDAVISDALNHASIIDGIRLCKAQRFRYQHDDMADLRVRSSSRLRGRECQTHRHRRRVLHGRHDRQPGSRSARSQVNSMRSR